MHLLLISPTPDDDTIIAEISTYKMKCVTINSLVATTLKTSMQNGTEYAVISFYYLTFQAEVFIFPKKLPYKSPPPTPYWLYHQLVP